MSKVDWYFSLWQKYPGIQNYLDFKSPGPKVSRSRVGLAYRILLEFDYIIDGTESTMISC